MSAYLKVWYIFSLEIGTYDNTDGFADRRTMIY